MLKLNISLLSIALCFILLVSCSSQQSPSAGSSSSSTSASDISQLREMTTDELHQYFQQAYDAKGNALDTPEQIALELAEVELITEKVGLLPEDYEAQYKKWRTGQIKDILDKLYGEYDQIVANLTQGSGPITGACYAEYIDFEGDGIPELFVLSLGKIPNYNGTDTGMSYVLEVYGTQQGQIEKLGEEHMNAWVSDSVGICKSEDASFVHAWHYAGKGDDTADDYYGMKDGLFTVLDCVSRSDPAWEWMDEANYNYTSFDQAISLEEYKAIQSKYSESEEIASLDNTTPSVNGRGILPEPSSDLLRRAAMLEAVNNTDRLRFATLIDTDQDGTEELVVLRESMNTGYGTLCYFRIYSWDGTGLQMTDLDKSSDSEITMYLQMGFSEYGIYRENSSDNIYFMYSGELVGGWGGTLFINANDFRFYSEPYAGDGSPESGIDYAEYEADFAQYQADLARYSLIEDCDTLYTDKVFTVESVRQQLIGE